LISVKETTLTTNSRPIADNARRIRNLNTCCFLRLEPRELALCGPEGRTSRPGRSVYTVI
jgi:hypothetical protein